MTKTLRYYEFELDHRNKEYLQTLDSLSTKSKWQKTLAGLGQQAYEISQEAKLGIDALRQALSNETGGVYPDPYPKNPYLEGRPAGFDDIEYVCTNFTYGESGERYARILQDTEDFFFRMADSLAHMKELGLSEEDVENIKDNIIFFRKPRNPEVKNWQIQETKGLNVAGMLVFMINSKVKINIALRNLLSAMLHYSKKK